MLSPGGLSKLEQAATEVDALQKELSQARVVVKAATEECNQLLEVRYIIEPQRAPGGCWLSASQMVVWPCQAQAPNHTGAPWLRNYVAFPCLCR